MKLWMDVMRDLEYLMNDHERILDAWAEGGVEGLVVGPMFFNAETLLPGPKIAWTGGPAIPSFDPDPAVYQRLGVEPPARPEPLPEKRALLEKTLLAAKARGWQVWIVAAARGVHEQGIKHQGRNSPDRPSIGDRNRRG